MLRVLCCVICLITGLMATTLHAATALCEGADLPESEHWHSPSANNWADTVPEQCRTCADSANREHASCAVYRILQSEACRDGHCTSEQGDFWLNWSEGYAIEQSTRFKRPLRYILDAGSNCWFMVWALEPVIGVEHARLRDSVNFWQVAFEVGTKQLQPPIPESEIAMIIQPANKRSQHQLHIHVGRLQSGYRELLDGLPAQPDGIEEIRFDGHDFVVRYLSDLPDQDPLEGVAVFEAAAAMIPNGESAMPLAGVLVARASNGAGTWVMAAQGLTRRELVVSQPQACRFLTGIESKLTPDE